MRAAAVAALAAACSADIEASWGAPTVETGIAVSGSIGPCTVAIAAGSCTLNWNTNYTAKIDATVPAIAGGNVAVNMKVDGLIPFKFTCALCGADCTITVPIVKKTITIPATPCPLPAGKTSNTTDVPIPAAPAGLPKTTVKGSVTITNSDGSNIATIPGIVAKVAA